MRIFDKNGIMIIPAPERPAVSAKEIIVIREAFCPNGHNLVSKRAKFGDYDGIIINVDKSGQKGLIALSPVYGDKARVSVDLDLADGELLKLSCPQCQALLPTYADCVCGGNLVVMFTRPEPDFKNCIGVCNRVGCKHAEIKNEGQLMTLIAGS